MSRRILTLDDLYNFYSNKGKSTHFSAKNDGDRIVVGVRGNILFDKNENDIEGLCPVSLQSCHILDNLNGSYISKKSMNNALPSFSNRPILAYIYKDDNGDYQFRDHAMHVDEDGETVYDEIPVGIIPESCNAHLQYDEEKDKTYVNVDGYIFEEYSRAHEILDREGECSVSVELSIRELSYDAKNKRLVLDDFYFSGVTILGRWEDGTDVKPGMAGSNIRISDFKQRNNVEFSEDKMIAMLNEINNKIDQLSINNRRKEEPEMEFEENVEVTETSDLMEETSVEDDNSEEQVVEEAATEESTEEVTVTEAQSEESTDVTPSEEDDEAKYEVSYTVTYGDTKKDFAVSLQEKISALYALVNDTYSEQDNCWYDVEVFEDPKYVIMSDFWTGKGYKQNYKVQKDVYSLVGDRIPVKQMWVTEDEAKQLEQMKADYAVNADKLAKYESEPQKMEILNSEDYAAIAESEEFVAFKAQDAHFDLSVDEVRAKADEMLLNAAKAGKVEFAAQAEEPKKEIGMKKLPINTKSGKTGRYGGIFSKK